MPRGDPFAGARFPKDVILLAAGWSCRSPLSSRAARDLPAARGVAADAATVYRWVQKFDPEIRKRACGRHRSWRGTTWHVLSRDIAAHSRVGRWTRRLCR